MPEALAESRLKLFLGEESLGLPCPGALRKNPRMTRSLGLGLWILGAVIAMGADPRGELEPGLAAYFEKRVAGLEASGTAGAGVTAENWPTVARERREQLAEMLGLRPEPPRTDLKPVITGTLERDGVKVEKLHFQSLPGLYVTGNLYLPAAAPSGKLPAILYVCGHGKVVENGVSYGNKTAYHHHGVWFARNGYVCLIIDTIQLGEIEGVHHGTYSEGRWWWYARGYTPAGVEAWNSIRALDYLVTRPEVDPAKLGVTGRSGGGAYSWWTAALDERIQAAVPVAGITALRSHIVEGCVEGHCDCMYAVNTYGWDFDRVASLVAPRALMISNTDKDSIFPVTGVFSVFRGTRDVYDRIGAGAALAINIEEGPHKDVEPLRTAAFHWFNRNLRGTDLLDALDVQAKAERSFTSQELKVFDTIPADQINTKIDEVFVPSAPTPQVPTSAEAWKTSVSAWGEAIQAKSFRGWPARGTEAKLTPTFQGEKDGVRLAAFALEPEPEVACALYVIHRAGLEWKELDLLVLNVLSESDWNDFLTHVPSKFPEAFPGIAWPPVDEGQLTAELKMHAGLKWGMAYLCPRGIGPHRWTTDAKKAVQIERRFALLGQTVDAMRVWDIRQGIDAIRKGGLGDRPLWLQAAGPMAGNAVYASIWAEPAVTRLDLHGLPKSHREGPIYLNVLKTGDLPMALAVAAERTPLRIYTGEPEAWSFVTGTAQALGWPAKQVELRPGEE